MQIDRQAAILVIIHCKISTVDCGKKSVCTSIAFKPDLCPKVSYNGHVSVIFMGYLLQTQ